MRRTSAALLALLLALSIVIGPRATQAAATPAGYKDGFFGSAPGNDPTADKPQSKLWWNDGAWWAVMYNQTAGEWHIYQLSWPDQWIDTGTLVDTRANLACRCAVGWHEAVHCLAGALQLINQAGSRATATIRSAEPIRSTRLRSPS